MPTILKHSLRAFASLYLRLKLFPLFLAEMLTAEMLISDAAAAEKLSSCSSSGSNSKMTKHYRGVQSLCAADTATCVTSRRREGLGLGVIRATEFCGKMRFC